MKKTNDKEQIERIKQMEQWFTEASAAIKGLSEALDAYGSVHEKIASLNEYYGSEAWKRDLADDEAGRLPEGLRRGVLSEDGIWNLLSDYRELNERLHA